MKQFLRYLYVVAAMLMVVVGDVWGQTYNGGTWYSLYDTEENSNVNALSPDFAEKSVFAPAESMTFEYKKFSLLSTDGKVEVYNKVNGTDWSSSKGSVSYSDRKNWKTSPTISLDANISHIRYKMASGTGVEVKNHFVKLKKHILLNDNTSNGQTWGVSSVTLTDNSLATAEGQTSTNYYTIKFRSFLATGDITITSSNPEFHFGNGKTSISLGVANNYCASANGSGNCSATTLGQISNYNKQVYFSPSIKYNKETRSTTIKITDGTSTAYIYLSAPVIPTYFFKAEAFASPAEGGNATATFPNGQNTYSLVATDYATASMSADVTFTAAPNTAYVFEGWKTDPASSTFYKQGADQTSFTETITSSALNPNELKSQLTYYAIYSRRYTAKITGSNYTGKLVNESWPADYQFVNTQTTKPTNSEADPFYFVIDHDFTGNDTREGSPRPNEVIAYDPTTNKITALNEGTATITFYQKNTDSHEPVSESFTVQVIKHTPVFTLNPEVTHSPEKLYFNKEYPNYFTTTANSPLTITSSDELVAKWVPGSNAQSYTLQTFSKTNTATLTAIQHENYYWARLEGSIDIQLQDPNNHVQNTPLTQENYIKDFQYSYQDPAADAKSPMGPDWNDGIYFGGEGAFEGDEGWNWGEKYIIIKFSGIPDSIYFTANRSGSATGTINLSIKQGTSPNNFEENIWESSESSNNNIGRKLKSDPTYNYLKISYEGNLWGRFKDVRITELNQFEAIDANKNLLSSINFGNALAVGVNHNQTFSFRYANAGHKVKFEIVSDTPENTATAKKYLSFLHNDFVTLDGEKCLTTIGGEKVGTVDNIILQFYSEKGDYTIPANTSIKISDEVGHTYYIPITGNIERATQTLSWQGLFLKEPVILPLTTGTFTGVAVSSNPDLLVTYTSSNPEVIAVSADGKSLTPLKEGEVYITANQAGNDKYKPAEPITKPVIVTGKKVQVIIWESNLTDLVVGDAPVTLSAKVYWIDMDNGAQGVYSEEQTQKLQFTSADPSIVSVEGNILTIHNAGETTVTAFVLGNDTYNEDQQVIPVRVRPTIVGCEDVLLLDHPDEFEFFKFDLSTPEVISPTYEIDHSKGVPGTLEFQHTGKPWTFAIEYYEGTIHAQQSIDGSTWTTVASVTPTKNATNISEGSPLDRQAKYIRFVRAQGGIGYHYVSNIKVHPAQYIEPSQEVIDFSAVQYGSKNTFTFDVAYSNIKYQISPKVSASDVQVSPQSFGACGAFGTQTITATWTPNEGGDNITRTITFTDVNTGMSATVTLKANVLKKDQFIKWEDAPVEIDDYSDIDSRPLKTVNASNEEVRDITYEIINGTDLAAFDNGMFYIKGTGEIRIRAYHNGDAEYKPVELIKDIKITSMSPTFVGTTNQLWATTSNWVNSIKPESLGDFAVILAPVTIAEDVSASGLQIASAGAIHITAKGGLTVGKGGIVGAIDGSITIDNTPEGAGFLRVDPTTDNKPAKVTVNYTTEAYNSGNPRDEVWQYMGAPGSNMQMSDAEKTTIYHWDEVKGWVKQSGASLTPFVGYAFTQNKADSATFTVIATPIIPTEVQEIELTVTPTGMGGSNLFVNSFLAPIDLATFTGDEFVGEVDETFYLFNSGSWTQWQNQGGSDEMNYGVSPGQYYALSTKGASLIDAQYDQTTIPPMQGVYVIARGNGAKIKLDYAKHVFNAEASNQPMRAPQRTSDDFKRVRLQVNSENSGADRMYVIQHDACTAGYDNGYDARNMAVSGQVGIYTHEVEGQMEISVSSKIDSTYIGFRAGSDSEYTLRMTSVVGEELYLKDLSEDLLIPVVDGQDYTFSATPNSVNDNRFLLLDQKSGVATDIEEVQVYIHDNMVHVMEAPENSSLVIYTIGGVAVANYSIGSAPCTIDLCGLPTGVYVLRINDKAYKFVCK